MNRKEEKELMELLFEELKHFSKRFKEGSVLYDIDDQKIVVAKNGKTQDAAIFLINGGDKPSMHIVDRRFLSLAERLGSEFKSRTGIELEVLEIAYA